MAIEITEGSSDMFLPLKAVVGALSVLIRNHGVSHIPVTKVDILTIYAPANREQYEADRRD